LARPDSVSSPPSVDMNDHFITSSLHSIWPWRWRQCIPRKFWHPPSERHSVMTQNTTVWKVNWQDRSYILYFVTLLIEIKFCLFVNLSFLFPLIWWVIPKIFMPIFKLIIFYLIRLTYILWRRGNFCVWECLAWS
jgi:hypothetical protein